MYSTLTFGMLEQTILIMKHSYDSHCMFSWVKLLTKLPKYTTFIYF
jgi:hypothetical protein